MANLPKRPREHVLEDLSIEFVKRVLPSEWIIEDGRKDYGIDLFIEIVEKEQVTGAHFLMQLKATDNLKILKNGDISFTFDKTSSLQYFLERSELVLFLLYDAKNQMGYWLWIQDYLRNVSSKNWKKQTSYAIRIPKSNQFNEFQVERIKRRILQAHQKEKILNFIETEDNSYVGYRAEFGKGFQKITGFYKYPGAEKDAPIEIGLDFKFDNTEEGLKAQQNLNNVFAKGEAAHIDACFIDKVRFPRLFSPELFGEADFQPDELFLVPVKGNRKFVAKVLIFDEGGQILYRISYVEFKETQHGTDEIYFSNEEQLIPIKMFLKVVFAGRTATFNMKMRRMGLNVVKVKEILEFQKAMVEGAWIELVSLDNGASLLKSQIPDTFTVAPHEDIVSFVDDLVFIQKATSVSFIWPDEDKPITYQNVNDAKKIVEIIQTGKSFEGNYFGINTNKKEAEVFLDSFEKSPTKKIGMFSPERVLSLLGKDIELGPTRFVLSYDELSEDTRQILENFDEIPDDEKIQISFDIEEPGLVFYHDTWMPKKEE